MRKPVNILVVDDRDENLIAVEAVLSDPGYRLVRARSGREALKEVLDQDFALILLDVVMPGVDGYETATLIRERPRSRQTPIIFLTANDWGSQHVFRGYTVGAVDYLVKPIPADVLRSKVAVFVELFNRQEALRIAQEDLEQRVVDRTRELADANHQPRQIVDLVVRRNDDHRTGRVHHATRRRVSSETAISTAKPSGIVTMPGWLKGTTASAAFKP